MKTNYLLFAACLISCTKGSNKELKEISNVIAVNENNNENNSELQTNGTDNTQLNPLEESYFKTIGQFNVWVTTPKNDGSPLTGEQGEKLKDPQGWATGNLSAIIPLLAINPLAMPGENSSLKIISKYETITILTSKINIFLTGLTFLGKFIFDSGKAKEYFAGTDSPAKLGIPYTKLPKKISLYYKYNAGSKYYIFDKFNLLGIPIVKESAGKDQLVIYASITRWNGNKREEIARAEIDPVKAGQSTSNFELIELPFIYKVSNTLPDSISVVFTPSAKGDKFEGADGSTLWIKDFNILY